MKTKSNCRPSAGRLFLMGLTVAVVIAATNWLLDQLDGMENITKAVFLGIVGGIFAVCISLYENRLPKK